MTNTPPPSQESITFASVSQYLDHVETTHTTDSTDTVLLPYLLSLLQDEMASVPLDQRLRGLVHWLLTLRYRLMDMAFPNGTATQREFYDCVQWHVDDAWTEFRQLLHTERVQREDVLGGG